MMKKSHYIILAFAISASYWLLDALANVMLYQSSFASEFFLLSSHNSPWIKPLTALLLFGLALIPLRKMPRLEKNFEDVKTLDALAKLSEVLFSSLSTKINVVKSLEQLENILHLEACLLFTYQKDTLLLYNENEFIKSAFRSKEIFPFRVNASISEVEHTAATCFVEKRAYSEDFIKHNGTAYTLLSVMILEEKSGKPIGNIMLASSSTKSLMPFLQLSQRFAEMLSFILSLQSKKENLEKLNGTIIGEHSSFDKVLNIMNSVKVQEAIENEYKRYKRYHTELTLLLIDINMLKNLISVFPSDAITILKRDFIGLIHKNIREVDIFGKWKEDQFAIVMPNVDFRAAQGLAKKIQLLLEEHKFARIGKITCSFGITSLSPKDTIGTFRARCESALTLATSQEGNHVEVKLLM